MAQESNFAAQDLTFGQLNALVKKMGGEKKVLDFLAGRLILTPFFTKEFGIYHLQITQKSIINYDYWVKKIGEERMKHFNPKFLRILKLQKVVENFEKPIGLIISSRPLTLTEMEGIRVLSPEPHISFLLKNDMPNMGISSMGFEQLIIMHQPIMRIEMAPAQFILSENFLGLEGFRKKGNLYPRNTGFVYIKNY